jgi:hypothetical protein
MHEIGITEAVDDFNADRPAFLQAKNRPGRKAVRGSRFEVVFGLISSDANAMRIV